MDSTYSHSDLPMFIFQVGSKEQIPAVYSECLQIIFWVPQRSIPFIQHIFSGSIFNMDYTDKGNYADVNTPYVTTNNIADVRASLENTSKTLFKVNESQYKRCGVTPQLSEN